MARWLIRNAEGKYLAQDRWDHVHWIDKPLVFQGEEAVVRGYYRTELAAGATLERQPDEAGEQHG